MASEAGEEALCTSWKVVLGEEFEAAGRLAGAYCCSSSKEALIQGFYNQVQADHRAAVASRRASWIDWDAR